jgi:hypothetical protein
MSYELLHFRGSEEIIKSKNMILDIQFTMEYIDEILYGSGHKREMLRLCMEEMDWLNKDFMSILDGRRYSYKGFKKGIAVESCLGMYEVIHSALFRLQLGFDKGLLDAGIILLNAQRSEKSPLGSTKELVEKEIQMLYPTISIPVSIALFDFGDPDAYMESILKNDVPVTKEKPALIAVPAIPDKPAEGSNVVYMVDNHSKKRSHVKPPVSRSNKRRRIEIEPVSAVI